MFVSVVFFWSQGLGKSWLTWHCTKTPCLRLLRDGIKSQFQPGGSAHVYLFLVL